MNNDSYSTPIVVPPKPMTRGKFALLTILPTLGLIGVGFIFFIFLVFIFLGIGLFECFGKASCPKADQLEFYIDITIVIIIVLFSFYLFTIFKKRYEYIFGKNLFITLILGAFFVGGIAVYCLLHFGSGSSIERLGAYYTFLLFALWIAGLILNPKISMPTNSPKNPQNLGNPPSSSVISPKNSTL